MTPERWQKIKSVLAEALEIDPEGRPAYLDQSCADDPSLRREVEVMLARERQLGSQFLSAKALSEAARAVLPEEDNPWLGRRVGAYKTTKLIGAGGMGEVYRAFRADDQYRKEVALKVVRTGQDSGFIVSRFKQERQILASLDHPNIAKLLDGGTTDEGLPYLVMDLIEGEPIVQYCDAHRLSITARLELFLQVCAAVQYAHQRLTIHRDIKPSNILVTADGTPKLLDFGIAKVLGSDELRANETLTAFRLLTPAYASPEQIKGEAVTTAGDVYSLGVVLYELLTGRSPYQFSGRAPQDLATAICEQEPERPSTVIQHVPTSQVSLELLGADQISANRDSSPHKLRKRLSGDLDTIVVTALRKDVSRRYSSVEQFSEDIRRSLANLPILARRDSVGYRTTKFISRHKAGVAAVALVAVILVAALVVTTREARIAQRRFNDVRSLANSLIFDVHDSVRDLPGSTPARKIIVDRALQYLNALASESSGDLSLQRELAGAYEKVGAVQGDYLENNLGDAAGTLVSYQKALGIRQKVEAASHDWNDTLALAQGYRLVAHQQWATGDMRGAREHINRAISISKGLNETQPNNLKILYELGFDHEVSGTIGYPGDPLFREKTIEDYRRAVAGDEVMLKSTPDDVRLLHGYAIDIGYIGNMLEATDPQGALVNYQKELEIDRKLSGLSTDVRFQRAVAIDYGSIASVYDDLGDYQQAAENNTKDLEIYKQLVLADPKNALLRQGQAIVYTNTATSLARSGKMETALEYSRNGKQIMSALVASAPQNTRQQWVLAAILAAHGTILISAKKPDAAIPEFEGARSIYESLHKAGAADKRSNVAACDVKLGEAAALIGHDQGAAEYFHQALAIVEPLTSTEKPDLDALYVAADAYAELGRLSLKKAQGMPKFDQQSKANWMQARSLFLQSQNMWKRIDHPNHTAPNSFEVGDPKVVAQQLKLTEAALSSSN